MKTSILNMCLMHMILTVNCILCRKSPNLIQKAKIQSTLEKLKVFGQLNPLEKCFKICYVYGKRKPM